MSPTQKGLLIGGVVLLAGVGLLFALPEPPDDVDEATDEATSAGAETDAPKVGEVAKKLNDLGGFDLGALVRQKNDSLGAVTGQLGNWGTFSGAGSPVGAGFGNVGAVNAANVLSGVNTDTFYDSLGDVQGPGSLASVAGGLGLTSVGSVGAIGSSSLGSLVPKNPAFL